MRPTPTRRRPSASFSFVAAACLSLLAAGAAWAQEIDGIVLGPFIVAPYLETDVEVDTNVLNAPPSRLADEADTSASLGGGLQIRMPFGNNELDFDYSGASVEYDNDAFAGGLQQEGTLALRLSFRSGDRLRIVERFQRDFSQIADSSIPPAGPGETPETKYFGSPFIYNRFTVELERSVPARRGYRVQLGRRDFNYEDGTIGSQYEFQGMDNSFEYYQPLSSSRQIVVHYSMTRLNNYRDSEGLFRKEVSDSLQAGLSGVGSVRPFFFRLGYSRFFYKYPEGAPTEDSSDYQGLSGFARWGLPFGGRSGMSLSVSRRPLPSSFDTYYISNQFRAIAERLFRPRVKVAVLVGVRQNQYADEIPELTCDGLRRDLTWDAGFRASWEVHPLLELRLAGNHEERNSNCQNVGYDSSSANLSMRIGWF